jgi:hypothetical protein
LLLMRLPLLGAALRWLVVGGWWLMVDGFWLAGAGCGWEGLIETARDAGSPASGWGKQGGSMGIGQSVLGYGRRLPTIDVPLPGRVSRLQLSQLHFSLRCDLFARPTYGPSPPTRAQRYWRGPIH